MDLGSERSVLRSVENNDSTTSKSDDHVLNIDHNNDEVKANGSYSNEIHNKGSSGIVGGNSLLHDGQVKEGIGQVENSANSEPWRAESATAGSPLMAKGYGLKRWRRIKRDVVKDASASVDISKVLKRGLSISGNPTKPANLMSAEFKQNSEGSTGSASVLRNVGVVDGLLAHTSSLETRFVVGSAFPPATDSENSEDRSSKSSTAASAPRLRYDLPTVLGYMREKNKNKNKSTSGKSVGNSTQRVQQGKARVETSKKPRGERVKIEKETSQSSMESDSRSSNFVFAQGVGSVISNGYQGKRSMNYDAENIGDAHGGESQLSEEVQTGYGEEKVGAADDVSQDDLAADVSWEGKGETSENHQHPTDEDPLLKCLITLQSVQESLENEVQKLGEIGKVSNVAADSTSADRGIDNSNSSVQFDSENIRQPSSLEAQVLSLTEHVRYLEIRLEEANALLKVKESRVAELENSMISGKLPMEESGNSIELHQEKSRDTENEFEGLFKQKIEAEIEYLTLTGAIQKLRVAEGDQITLFKQQEALAGQQAEMLDKLGVAEKKAATLEKQAEKVENYREDFIGTEEMLNVQIRACKVASCFSIQLILLIFVLWLLVLKLSPHSGVVVPT